MRRSPNAFIPALAACMAFVNCGSKDEVARVTSPAGDVDGVVVETNGGATTSYGYEIYVVERGRSHTSGSRVAFLYAASRSEDAYGVNLRWVSTGMVAVEYLNARSAVFDMPIVQIAGRQVTVALVSDVRDYSAPPGGMLYNLRLQGR